MNTCASLTIGLFPIWIVEQYNLLNKVVKGHIYLEMQRARWGLPQAGILANKLLCKRLAPNGYYKCKQMPGLRRHTTPPNSFTLVGGDFGVKYTNKSDVNQLIECLKTDYKLTEDWDGNLYCGIKLKWDYNTRTLDISMSGYIVKQLQKYKHDMPTWPQHCPYTPHPRQYVTNAQRQITPDLSPPLSKDEIKPIQQIIGLVAFYIMHTQ